MSPKRTTNTSVYLIDHALNNLGTGKVGGVHSEPTSDHLPIFVAFDSPACTKSARFNIVAKIDYKALR